MIDGFSYYQHDYDTDPSLITDLRACAWLIMIGACKLDYQ